MKIKFNNSKAKCSSFLKKEKRKSVLKGSFFNFKKLLNIIEVLFIAKKANFVKRKYFLPSNAH